MLAGSSVLGSKALDSRSGQKTSILPKSVQGKSPCALRQSKSSLEG